jgi:hypothetical protein
MEPPRRIGRGTHWNGGLENLKKIGVVQRKPTSQRASVFDGTRDAAVGQFVALAHR